MGFQDEKSDVKISGSIFWVLIMLPSILAFIVIIFSLFAEFVEYGIIPFIGPIVIVAINVIIVIFVAFSRLSLKRAELQLSEEVAEKNYAKHGERFFIDWRKITKLEYSGKIDDQNCNVCKLPLHEKNFILQCSKCNALFHGQHLIEWLGKDDACPICAAKIMIT